MSTIQTGRFFPVQIMGLGSASSFATFNEQTLSNAGVNPWLGQLGQIIEQDAKVYRLVQFDQGVGVVLTIAGGPVHWKTRASFIVTPDQTDAQAGINSVAGGALGVITNQYYGFVQIGGLQSCKTATVAAVGAVGVGSVTDNQFAITAAGTAPVGVAYAVAYSTDSSSFASFYWNLGNLL